MKKKGSENAAEAESAECLNDKTDASINEIDIGESCECEETDCPPDGRDGLKAGEPEAPEPTQEQKYAELLDRYQRSLADFDNFRKRTLKEKAAAYEEGLRDTVEKLLPIIDNFERALNSAAEAESKFYQGIAMIARQMDSLLAEMGVETIPASRGDGFDHKIHFAVAHVEDENYGENEIIDELQKGYKHKDKLIRPSMVRVAN